MLRPRPATSLAGSEPHWHPAPRPPAPRLPPGWPLALGLAGYPIAWLLGLRLVWWPVLAVLLVGWLVRRRRVLLAPRGFGWWACFLAWTFVCALTLTSAGRLAAWGYREAFYLSATAVLLFCVNVTERELPTRRIAFSVLGLFGSAVVLGTMGILLPDLTVPTLGDLLLPSSVEGIQFVQEQTQARLGATAEFIGAVRPCAPFGYTNEWGAAVGMLWPLAVYGTSWVESSRRRLVCWALIAFSIVPIVISVNRGLWVSIAVAVTVVGLRALLGAQPRTTVGVLGLALGGLVVIWLTPLRGVIEGRLARPNLGTRETLVSDAVTLLRGSPLYGYGAPQSAGPGTNANDVSVGTHGQLWTLLVSNGLPGALFYLGFFVAMLVLTWRVAGPAIWAWSSIVVMLVQLLFYNSLPVPLILGMIAVAVCLRDTGRLGTVPPAGPAPAHVFLPNGR